LKRFSFSLPLAYLSMNLEKIADGDEKVIK